MNVLHTLYIVLFSAVSIGISAQDVITHDSLSIQQRKEAKTEQYLLPYEQKLTIERIIDSNFRPENPTLTATSKTAINPKTIETTVQSPYLMKWKGGYLTGANSVYNAPFFLDRNASFISNQQWGNFYLSGNLLLSKSYISGFGFTNGAGLGLQLNYHINDNISISGFGCVQQTGFMGPAPNIRNYYYGGFVSVNTNNGKWGMDVGMRRYYNAATGQWTNVPIVMPYYNLNGHKLGIDFGGLLMNVFQGMDKALNPNNYRPRRGGEIIMPEVMKNKGFGPPEIPYIK